LRFHSTKTWTLNCNWKVVCDNYLDGGYHIPHRHPSLDAQLDMQRYTTQLSDTFSIQTAPPARTQDERIDFDAKMRIGEAARYAWLYPNWMINRYGPSLDTNLVIPLAPDRCEVRYEFYFLETEGLDAERFLEDSIAQSAVTQREDIDICESVQRGLASTSYDTGRYAPQLEVAEHHFHGLLAAALRAARNSAG
jgi:choline monooxygenase